MHLISSSVQVNKNIDGRMIVVGVCAMAKKTNSKPMKEILARLHKFEHLQVCKLYHDSWPSLLHVCYILIYCNFY